MMAKRPACTNSSIPKYANGNIISYKWVEENGVGRLDPSGSITCNLFNANDSRTLRNGTVHYGDFAPGEAGAYNNSVDSAFNGGGAGWYGGGAGSFSSCYAASAGGGSSVNNVSGWANPNWGAFTTNSPGASGKSGHGQAVVRRCRDSFDPTNPYSACDVDGDRTILGQ